MIDQLRNRFNNLEDRDRRALKLMLLFVPVVVYLAILEPAYNYYYHQRQAYLDTTELLQWMHRNRNRIPEQPNSTMDKAKSKDLMQLVSTTAESRNISFDRIQPTGKNQVRVYSDKMEFRILLEWLNAVHTEGLILDRIRVEKSATPGYVGFQGTLKQ